MEFHVWLEDLFKTSSMRVLYLNTTILRLTQWQRLNLLASCFIKDCLAVLLFICIISSVLISSSAR